MAWGSSREDRLMSIRVMCPNGHVLNVKDDLAGRSGLCPTCKARVQIPKPSEDVDEEAILDILGTFNPRSVEEEEFASRGSALGNAPPKKTCPKCYREVLAATHICPYCHFYIAELKDFTI
jgi:hypothetical protein